MLTFQFYCAAGQGRAGHRVLRGRHDPRECGNGFGYISSFGPFVRLWLIGGGSEIVMTWKCWIRIAAFASAAAALAACTAVPSAGPTAVEIVNNESRDNVISGYVVVDIDARIAALVSRRRLPTLAGMFRDGKKPPDVKIGIGDSITVTIWEAASGGLFSTASIDKLTPGSRTATLPEQEVAQNGTIQVPYAGRIKVSGLRPAEVETRIAGTRARGERPEMSRLRRGKSRPRGSQPNGISEMAAPDTAMAPTSSTCSGG